MLSASSASADPAAAAAAVPASWEVLPAVSPAEAEPSSAEGADTAEVSSAPPPPAAAAAAAMPEAVGGASVESNRACLALPSLQGKKRCTPVSRW
jgi:hypothetical protein